MMVGLWWCCIHSFVHSIIHDSFLFPLPFPYFLPLLFTRVHVTGQREMRYLPPSTSTPKMIITNSGATPSLSLSTQTIREGGGKNMRASGRKNAARDFWLSCLVGLGRAVVLPSLSPSTASPTSPGQLPHRNHVTCPLYCSLQQWSLSQGWSGGRQPRHGGGQRLATRKPTRAAGSAGGTCWDLPLPLAWPSMFKLYQE